MTGRSIIRKSEAKHKGLGEKFPTENPGPAGVPGERSLQVPSCAKAGKYDRIQWIKSEL